MSELANEIVLYQPNASVRLEVILGDNTQFRIWATNVLREYLLRGYAVNQKVEKLEQGCAVRACEKNMDLYSVVPKVRRRFLFF